MNIRKFNAAKDLILINKWNKGWNMEPLQAWWLPETNFIASSDGCDIIFASLYQTDSKVAYFENVVGNPGVTSEERQAALGIIGDHIFNYARDLGFKVVLGWTSNKSVAKTSAKHGMILTEYNHATMIKVL